MPPFLPWIIGPRPVRRVKPRPIPGIEHETRQVQERAKAVQQRIPHAPPSVQLAIAKFGPPWLKK